jgi:hypothetical protein
MLGYLPELSFAGEEDLARLLQQACSLGTLKFGDLLLITDERLDLRCI